MSIRFIQMLRNVLLQHCTDRIIQIHLGDKQWALLHQITLSQFYSYSPKCQMTCSTIVQCGVPQCFTLSRLSLVQSDFSVCLILTEPQTNFSPRMCLIAQMGNSCVLVFQAPSPYYSELQCSLDKKSVCRARFTTFPHFSPIFPVSLHSTPMKKFVKVSEEDVLPTGCCLNSG